MATGLTAQAQSVYSLQGRVIDSATRQPLPFVNLVVEGTQQGTATDIDGRFVLKTSQASVRVVFSFVGYQRKTLRLSSEQPTTIRLAEQAVSTKEVTIVAGENPAHRIIRRAVANKPLNNPLNLPHFAYKSHNKFFVTFSEKELAIPLPADSAGTKTDTLRKEVDSLAQRMHLFYTENITQRRFAQPDLSNETILATRTAGFPQLALVQVATDFQPFGFYQDWVTVFNFQFLNPLSDNAWNRYDFTLEQEIADGSDTAFIISYKPRKGKNFNGLEGVMRIHSSRYALENIIATQADSAAFLKFHIQQQYTRPDGQTWFPFQFTTDIRHRTLQVARVPVVAMARTVIDSIDLGRKFRNRYFLSEDRIIPKAATERSDDFWQANRIDSLKRKEYQTLYTLDTLIENNAKGLRGFLTALEHLSTGTYPLGKVDLVLNRLLAVNLFEGARIGLGFQTNELFSRVLEFGAYGAYGFRDDAFKYGGHASLLLSERTQTKLIGRAWHDIREPGAPVYPFTSQNLLTTESLRRFLMDRADYSTGWSAGIQGNWLRYLQTDVSLIHQKLDLPYTYRFQPTAERAFTGYDLTEVCVSFRYAHGEKYTRFKGKRLQTASSFPEIRFQLGQGFQDLLGGQFDYRRFEFRVDHKHHWVELGTTRFGFQVGATTGDAPYAVLFNGRGSLNRSYPVVIDNTFQTMGLYEFLNDTYSALFFSHDFGHIKLKTKYSRPGLILYQNIGLGALASSSNHRDVPFKTMEKGFYESGAVVTDLLRVEYLDMFYYGLGAGVFYRYGPYGLPKTSDNVVYKLMLTLSF